MRLSSPSPRSLGHRRGSTQVDFTQRATHRGAHCPTLQTLGELKAATVCSNGFGDVYDLVDGVQVKLSGWEESSLAPYVKAVISPTLSDCPGIGAYQCGVEWCHDQLLQGNADIWLEDALMLHEFQQNNDACDNLHLRREISILRSYYNLPLVLPLSSPLLGPLSEVRLLCTQFAACGRSAPSGFCRTG